MAPCLRVCYHFFWTLTLASMWLLIRGQMSCFTMLPGWCLTALSDHTTTSLRSQWKLRFKKKQAIKVTMLHEHFRMIMRLGSPVPGIMMLMSGNTGPEWPRKTSAWMTPSPSNAPQNIIYLKKINRLYQIPFSWILSSFLENGRWLFFWVYMINMSIVFWNFFLPVFWIKTPVFLELNIFQINYPEN